ncbi:probable indole-3-pyruvate monooxygenase YUCCA10 [Typha latifolia]|uniref:probable indole-3-pyruvate monooxygenase YUCCA10 n=1 Tax=Typha latifolia TaxID=4733 RepID=UPI003C2FB5A6
MEEPVLIVGAGPSGLAASACLGIRSIPSLILERDDCVAPLWRKHAYDRVHLHLAKQFCELPHAPYPCGAPTFLPRLDFVSYLDAYVARFRIRIRFGRRVESAEFDRDARRWRVVARVASENGDVEEEEVYLARFLVVAAGENDVAVVPEVPGLGGFGGPVVHSSRYRSGLGYKGKRVLVVGCGNSGMEIALDLAEAGARVSIVVRNELHLVSRGIWFLGMILIKVLPLRLLDAFILLLCYLKFGDTSKFGIERPPIGPFYMKLHTPIYPVVDVGTYEKIKSGEIKVLPSLTSIKGNLVTFSDGKVYHFDAIIFATGYKSSVKEWLKSDDCLIGEDGMAKENYPNHWRGRNGLYCVGLARRGIYGSSEEAQLIATDINKEYNKM